MAKVQRPMSAAHSRELETELEANATADCSIQASPADVGPWTLDVGPSAGLCVTDLRKAFLSPTGERIDVLRGGSFSARAGEAVAILGDSGAGKSTLLHLLGGLEAADHGS